jgi:lysine 2,3-aminomutase
VAGAGHFRTSVSKGIEIIEGLRGHTSGYAVPQYIVDAPGGGGKIPVAPQYLISQGSGKVVLRNFEGFITTYTEAGDYDPDAIKAWEAKVQKRPEPGQEGVSGLLEGNQLSIKPEGFDEAHQRGGIKHRLNQDESKWTPFHVQEDDKIIPLTPTKETN